MFDPTFPQENTPIDAAPMRAQLNSLKALIDAIVAVTAAQVDTVNTLPPGFNATVDVSVSGDTLHFTFGIPQGNDGQQGPQGAPGEVTLSELNSAAQSVLNESSANSNAVGILGQSADPDYNQAQMQTLFSKVDELIQALRR